MPLGGLTCACVRIYGSTATERASGEWRVASGRVHPGLVNVQPTSDPHPNS